MTVTGPPSESRLKRRLGLVDVLAIGVNAIVGSGVFAVPGKMQRTMGGLSPLSYLLCALVLIPVALCFAELASSVDKNGGPYVYALRAFGPIVGFVVGWSCYLNAFLSFAANATVLGALAGLEQNVLYRPLVVGIVLLLGAINYVGVRPGANLIHLMTAGKLLAIFLFVGVAILHFQGSRLGGPLPAGMHSVANGVYLALFPLQGFEVVPVPAGETKNPNRNIPIATIGSLVFAAVLFTIVQGALVGSYADLAKESNTPLVDAAKTFGPLVGVLVLAGSIVSVGGFTAGSALGLPRYAQALADAGQLPSALSSVHPRYGTPHVAIAATTLLTAALAAVFTYEQLVGFSNVTVVFQYTLTCAAVPILRLKAKALVAQTAEEEESEAKARELPVVTTYRSPVNKPLPAGVQKGFRVPFGPVLPIFGALGSIAFLIGSTLEDLVWAASGIAAGGVIALAQYFQRRRSAAS